jgi:glyoxylate reductase
MHSLLDPAPALLADACEVVRFPSNRPLDEDTIRAQGEGCAGILSQVIDPIGEKILSMPGLKIVSNCAVGYDNIDVPTATKYGVLVTNTPGILDETTADFAFALMMAAARRVVQADNFVRGGNFKGWAIDMMVGQDIHDSTLGIVGLGRIGRAVAKRARGFNMQVLYSDDQPAPPEIEEELRATRVELDKLLAEADFVTMHVPLTDATRHMISRQQLATMKPTAILVNASRGPVVDEAALVEALKTHEIFAAGLDVYEREPEVQRGLLALHNVVLAPHIASASVRTRSEMSAVAARNLITGIRGGVPANLVNPEART